MMLLRITELLIVCSLIATACVFSVNAFPSIKLCDSVPLIRITAGDACNNPPAENVFDVKLAFVAPFAKTIG